MPYILLDYSKLLILAAFVTFRKFEKTESRNHRWTQMKIHDSTAVRYCSIKTALGEADLHGGGAGTTGTTDGHRCTRMKIHDSSAVGYRSSKTALGEAHLDGGGGRGGGAVLDDGAGWVGDDGVAAIQDEEGAELGELGGELRDGAAAAGELPAQGLGGGGVGLVEAAAVGRESGAQVEIVEAGGERAFGAGVPLEQRAQEIAQVEFEFVDARGLAAHGAVQQSQRPFDRLLLPAARQHSQVVAHGVHQLLLEAGDAVEQFLAGADDHLGGGRGRGGAQVGDEIGDGHVGFMAHGGHDRYGAARDGAGDSFFVEGPEVFKRAAAAGHDHQFGPGVAAEIIETAADLLYRAFALHQRWEEPDVETGEAAGQDLNHVGDDGAARRGDDADALGVARQRALAAGLEEAFFRQLLLELFEGELQRAVAQRLQEFDDELVFAARLEDVDAAARQ